MLAAAPFSWWECFYKMADSFQLFDPFRVAGVAGDADCTKWCNQAKGAVKAFQCRQANCCQLFIAAWEIA